MENQTKINPLTSAISTAMVGRQVTSLFLGAIAMTKKPENVHSATDPQKYWGMEREYGCLPKAMKSESFSRLGNKTTGVRQP